MHTFHFTLAVFAAAFAMFRLFANYGFQVEDEGTILFQLAEVAAGKRPFVDFFAVYGPGFYRAGAWILGDGGFALERVRLALAVVNAAVAAGIYALAAAYAGRRLALVGSLAWLACLPVEVGDFASFNIPYAAWPVGLAWVFVTGALLGWVSTQHLALLAAAGGAAAVALSLKVNAGAFAATAAVFVVAVSTRAETVVDRAFIRFSVLAVVAGVLFALRSMGPSIDSLVHLVPMACLALAALGRLRRPDRPWRHPPIAALAALTFGFVAVTASWAIPDARVVGPGFLFRSVFLINSEFTQLYRIEYPRPDGPTFLLLAVVAGLMLCTRIDRRYHRSFALAGAVLAIAAAAVLPAHGPFMIDGIISSIVSGLRSAAFWLIPMVHAVGLAWLFRARALDEAIFARRFVFVAVSVAMYWQVYPRVDTTHVAFVAQGSIVLAVVLLGRTIAAWAGDRRPHRALLERATVVAALAITASALLPAARQTHRAVIEPAATGGDVLERLAVGVEPEAGGDLRDLREAVVYLQAQNLPDEPVLTFPALAAVLYGAKLGSALPHYYWWPGQPDKAEERRLVASLEQEPPRFAVTQNDRFWYFVGAAAYFRELSRFVKAHYRPVARFGRYDVMARADLIVGSETSNAPATRYDAANLFSATPAYRRAAASAWMPRVTPSTVRHASLPSDPRTAVRLLRAIRDGGDLRATAWILCGLRDPNGRVRANAADAARSMASNWSARSHSWAADNPDRTVARALRPIRAELRRLRQSPEAGPRAISRAAGSALRTWRAREREAPHAPGVGSRSVVGSPT